MLSVESQFGGHSLEERTYKGPIKQFIAKRAIPAAPIPTVCEDIIGTLINAVVGAYWAHLLIGFRKTLNKG